MNAQDLRNSILQRAIEGKLVPQRADEGTAKDLLREIQTEKARLIKEKKIKKTKPLPAITDDEKPFDLPESWEWVRLQSICTKIIDGDHNPPVGIGCESKYLMLSAQNINNDTINFERVRYLDEETFKKEDLRTKATKGDIFFTIVGTLGRSCVYEGGSNICFQRSVSVITTLIYNYYLKYVLDSYFIRNYMELNAKGTAQKGFYLKQVNNLCIPLPPLAEQKRIVAKIETFLPDLAAYDDAQTELHTLTQRFPDDMKKSLLQYAIEGKLVPQRAEEGTAKDLLREIQTEKARLIKEKKIKKTKPLPAITDDEKPFDLPESWEWVRLQSICTKIIDGDHNPPVGIGCESKYLMLSAQNINNDTINFERVRYLDEETFKKEDLRTKATKGDIFFTIVGTLGRSCVYEGGSNICFQRSVSVITTLIYNYYLKYVLDSYFIRNYMELNAKGTAQKGFYLKQVNNLCIPLPPLAEQHRIVARLEELLPLCQQLDAQP